MNRAEKVKSTLQVLLGGHIVAAGFATYHGNEDWYRRWLMPGLALLGPDVARNFIVRAARHNLIKSSAHEDPTCLHIKVLGQSLSNPVGLAAGFDKEARTVSGLLNMGFGMVEVGPVNVNNTDRCDQINSRRQKEVDQDVVYQRLEKWSNSGSQVIKSYSDDDRNMLNENFPSPERNTIGSILLTGQSKGCGIVGVNLSSHEVENSLEKKLSESVMKFGNVTHYQVLNFSTFKRERRFGANRHFQNLIEKLLTERDKSPRDSRPTIVVKIPLNVTELEKIFLANVLAKPQREIDGIIVCDICESETQSTSEASPIQEQREPTRVRLQSTELIGDMYKLTQGRVPIIGAGAVSSGLDAYKKICAGASLVQIDSVLLTNGPPVVKKIKCELAEILINEGFSSVSQAVGLAFRQEN